MGAGKRIVLGTSATWLGQAVGIGARLILMPILFRFLPREELGLWFLIGGSSAFVGLMDLGFSRTFKRYVAFAKGKTSSDPDREISEATRQEIADILATGRFFYSVLALFVFALAWTTGFYFLRALDVSTEMRRVLWLAWTIMCAGHAVGVWGKFLTFLIQGMGDVAQATFIGILLSLVGFLASVTVVISGHGLVGLAAVGGVMGVMSRAILHVYVRRRYPTIVRLNGVARLSVLRPMVRPALRVWVVWLGTFLVLRTDDYFIAWFRGASDLPDYRIAYVLVMNMYVAAMAVAMVSNVFVSQAFQAGDWSVVRRLVLRSVRAGLALMVAGVAVVATMGDGIFHTWLGGGHFVGWLVLWTFCLMLTLECQHMILSNACVATNDIPFAPWAIAAGILNIVFTLLLIRPLGLWGVALATMFAQLLTNNWYGVWRSLRRLRIPLRYYARTVALPVGIQFLVAAAGSYGIRRLVFAPWARIVGALGWSGFLCSLMLWFGTLGAKERGRIATIAVNYAGFLFGPRKLPSVSPADESDI